MGHFPWNSEGQVSSEEVKAKNFVTDLRVKDFLHQFNIGWLREDDLNFIISIWSENLKVKEAWVLKLYFKISKHLKDLVSHWILSKVSGVLKVVKQLGACQPKELICWMLSLFVFLYILDTL